MTNLNVGKRVFDKMITNRWRACSGCSLGSGDSLFGAFMQSFVLGAQYPPSRLSTPELNMESRRKSIPSYQRYEVINWMQRTHIY